MGDLFDIRIEYLDLLEKITASHHSLVKASVYALNHAEDHSDMLHACLMEQFRSGSLNHRMNLMYLLEILATARDGPGVMSASVVVGEEGCVYRLLIEGDLEEIVKLTVPATTGGLVNLPLVKKVSSEIV
jgi:CTD kinase subunit gamma